MISATSSTAEMVTQGKRRTTTEDNVEGKHVYQSAVSILTCRVLLVLLPRRCFYSRQNRLVSQELKWKIKMFRMDSLVSLVALFLA